MMSLRGSAAKKKDCVTFESQQWRKNVCKNCFRSQAEHNAPRDPSEQGATAEPPLDRASKLGELPTQIFAALMLLFS